MYQTRFSAFTARSFTTFTIILDKSVNKPYSHQIQVIIYFLMLIVLPTLGTITAVILAFQGHFSWDNFIMCIALTVLTELGSTMGFHRMLVHQSFTAHP
ncbi:MAG: hypothetical protein ACO3EO_04205, partial [Candidatus Kapaibacteriota bacterium]